MWFLEISVPTQVQWPLWLIAVVVILKALENWIPAIGELFGKKDCEKRCKALENKNEILELENKSLYSYKEKYLKLFGYLFALQNQIAESGIENLKDILNDEGGSD